MVAVLVRVGPPSADDLLESAVSDALGCVASEVRIAHRCDVCGEASHGRPIVSTPGHRRIWVSRARSGTTSVAAIARRPVGIDVEEGDQADGGLRTWVRKEAVLKATGEGLTLDPDRLVLGPGCQPPRVERWLVAGRRPEVRILDLDVGDGRLAAVAVVGRRSVRVELSRR